MFANKLFAGSNTHNNGGNGGDGQTGDAGEGTGGQPTRLYSLLITVFLILLIETPFPSCHLEEVHMLVGIVLILSVTHLHSQWLCIITGTDRHNFLQMLRSDLNFPAPFENTTMWDMVESVNHPKATGLDLAIGFATSGYYCGQ